MKKILFLFLFISSISVYTQNNDLNWMVDFDKAQKLSKKENKPILIYFTGSDWCPPCKMLKKDFFNSEEFKSMAHKLILVEADFPRRIDVLSQEQEKKNKELAKKYNSKGSFPTVVMVNSKGKVYNTVSGYTLLRDPENHFNLVKQVLAKY